MKIRHVILIQHGDDYSYYGWKPTYDECLTAIEKFSDQKQKVSHIIKVPWVGPDKERNKK